MILLQTTEEIWRASGGGAGLLLPFALTVLGVAVLILIGTLIVRRQQPRTAADMARYSSTVFRRTGREVGLTPPQVETLEKLVRACKVKRPFMVFTSAGLLDDTLKRGLYSIDSARGLPEEERENRRAVLFEIKQTLERNARRGATLGSTIFLKPGQPLSVTPEGGTPFSSKVVSNMRDFLSVSAPPLSTGTDSRWTRGTRLSVYLWRENDAGYSFPSKILGYDKIKGASAILIQHSRTIRREQRRRSRRRELLRPCFYYPIRVTEIGEGRRAERKAVVETNQRTLGTIVDLSPGGCAMQSQNPAEKGRLVMIEFDIDKKQPIRAFGKVVRVKNQPGKSGQMNIMFTRVTRQNLNRISEYVYDFSRPATVAQALQQMDRAIPGRRPLPPVRPQ